jgi:hypothetical protein
MLSPVNNLENHGNTNSSKNCLIISLFLMMLSMISQKMCSVSIVQLAGDLRGSNSPTLVWVLVGACGVKFLGPKHPRRTTVYIVHRRKSTLAPRCICTRWLKIIFQNVKKFWKKILSVRLHILCSLTKFCKKKIIFMTCVKKIIFYATKLLFT